LRRNGRHWRAGFRARGNDREWGDCRSDESRS
jgi:hypothetical protein